MPYVITDPCTKDGACVEVCPVECIHPKKDEPEFETAPMLFINPADCIDCGACVPVCPTTAIYDSIENVPASQRDLIEANEVWYSDKEEATAIVQKHAQDHPGLMALDPAERQASH